MGHGDSSTLFGSHFGYHPRPYSLNLLELFDDPLTLMRQVLFQPVLLLPNLIPLKTTDFRPQCLLR